MYQSCLVVLGSVINLKIRACFCVNQQVTAVSLSRFGSTRILYFLCTLSFPSLKGQAV